MFLAIRKRMEKREEGFTLIELLVVVIIIGILAAIAIPAFLNQRERARVAALQSDLRNAAIEIETVATNNGGSYTGATLPANFRYSTGVKGPSTAGFAVTIPTGGASFCLQGVHTGVSGQVWEFDSDDSPQLNLQSGTTETCNN